MSHAGTGPALAAVVLLALLAFVPDAAAAEPASYQVSWSADGVQVLHPTGETTTWLGGTIAQRQGDSLVQIEPALRYGGGDSEAWLDLSALNPPWDDLGDARLLTSIETSIDSADVQRSLSLLEGTRHADVRTRLDGPAGEDWRLWVPIRLEVSSPQTLQFVTQATAQEWSFEDVGTTTLDLSSSPNAAFRLVGSDGSSAGVVVAGHIRSAALEATGRGLALTVEYAGKGVVSAAQYLAASGPGEAASSFVSELARQDAEELGLVYLASDRAAAVGWETSGAEILVDGVGARPSAWDRLWGYQGSWTVSVEAGAQQGGKSLRVLLDEASFSGRRVRLTLDGIPLQGLGLADGPAALLVPISHFSLRTVQIKTQTTGVAPIWKYATFALGMTLAAGGGFVGVSTLRSRAALHAFEKEARAEAGIGPRSAAVARALGPAPGAAAATASSMAPPGGSAVASAQFKSALLRKLASEGAPAGPVVYARCSDCQRPIRFEGDAATVACPHCGAENVNRARLA